MDEKDKEEVEISNHKFILKFLLASEVYENVVADSLKATIAQFLQKTLAEVCDHSRSGNEEFTLCDFLQVQVDNLRRCIVDLEQCRNIILDDGGTVQ